MRTHPVEGHENDRHNRAGVVAPLPLVRPPSNGEDARSVGVMTTGLDSTEITVGLIDWLFGSDTESDGEASGAAASTPRPTDGPIQPAEPTEQTEARASDAVEQVFCLHPHGWTEVEIVLSARDGVPRVEETDVTLAEEGPDPRAFHLDPARRRAWLAEFLAGIYHEMVGDLAGFASWNVHVERTTDQTVRLSNFGHTFEIDLPDLVVSPALLRLFDRHGESMEERQESLETAIEPWGDVVDWNQEDHALIFENEEGTRHSLPADLVGSFSPPEHTWLWGWANESLASDLRAPSREIPDRAPNDLGIVDRDGFFCDQPFSYSVAMFGSHVLGKQPMFRFPVGPDGPHLYFAVEASED